MAMERRESVKKAGGREGRWWIETDEQGEKK